MGITLLSVGFFLKNNSPKDTLMGSSERLLELFRHRVFDLRLCLEEYKELNLDFIDPLVLIYINTLCYIKWI